MKKLQYLAEYGLLRLLMAVLTRLPRHRADSVGATLGGLGYAPFGIRRRVVDSNLALAFPDRDQAWRDRVARDSYRHLGREMVAMLRLAAVTPEEILEQTKVFDPDDTRGRYERKGKGTVVVVGHFGNWEIGAATMGTRGVPLDIIAKRQNNPWFDRYINGARARFGAAVIERSVAPRLALKALKKNHGVVFAADQNAGRSGVFVPFFGHLASTHRGAALIAIKTGAPVTMALPVRQPDGSYCSELVMVEEHPERYADDIDAGVTELTARFTSRIEQAIRQYPEQYLWQHKRWKTRPPDAAASQ